MTTIGELCGRTVWMAFPGESVLDAARRMRDQHVGCLVVVEEREGERIPIGMLTDRDIAVRVVAAGEDSAMTYVADAMSRDLVRAREAEPLEDVVSRMRAFGVRRVPVVDRHDALQGIVSFDDLLEHLGGQLGELARLFAREQERESARVSASPVERGANGASKRRADVSRERKARAATKVAKRSARRPTRRT